MYGPRHKTYSESHNLPDDDFRLSEPKLRLSLQRMYEKGRASVKAHAFSLSDVLAGSFAAEAVTSLFYIAKGGLQGVDPSFESYTDLHLHGVLSVILGVLTCIAYYIRSANIQRQCADNRDRDRSVSEEIDSLTRGNSISIHSDYFD